MLSISQKLLIKRRQDAIDKIVHKGLIATRQASFNLRARVLASYRRAVLPEDIASYLLQTMVPQLRDAMVVSHILARQHRDTLALSTAFDGILGKLADADILELQKVYNTQAFTVWKDVSASIEHDLRRTVLELIQSGTHEAAGIKVLREAFDNLGITDAKDYQLGTIFRTQTQIAYGAGNWEAYKEVDDILWGFKYVTVGDDSVRPSHAALAGVTLPKNHSFWDRFWPPNGWNCRCQAIPLYLPEPIVEPPSDIEPDEGFGFNVGKIFAFSWNDALHPRGPDGKFISTGAAIDSLKIATKSFKNKLMLLNKDNSSSHIKVPLKTTQAQLDEIKKAFPGKEIKKVNAQKLLKPKMEKKPVSPDTEHATAKAYYKKKFPGISENDAHTLANLNGKAAGTPNEFIPKSMGLGEQPNEGVAAKKEYFKSRGYSDSDANTLAIINRHFKNGNDVIPDSVKPISNSKFTGDFFDLQADFQRTLGWGVSQSNTAKLAALNANADSHILFAPLSMKGKLEQLQKAYPNKKIVFKNASKLLKKNLLTGSIKVEAPKKGVGEDVSKWGSLTSATETPNSVPFADRKKWSQSLTSEQLNTVQHFTGSGFVNIRRIERGDTKDMLPNTIRVYKKHAERLKSALDSAPKFRGVVYRGMRLNANDAFFNEHKEGGTLTLNCSSSASRNPSVAKKFGGTSVMLRVLCKTGVSVEHISYYQPEKEVILRKGSKYKIHKVHRNKELHGSQVVYDLEEI